ncbi:hypothetical protein NA655_08635 [Pseudomonas kuykendallii]|uniref:Uncharacterized protein n=1 Tax=Pseudomonas kuykendallii TaxID=1007099 RepID=A0A1H3EKH8_9PSED|nr:hypothetical protein [Pseudomonas kuykendallii]MCQ4271086.1 hypothetical protein [Pseudomonas kuykendallii]SDX78444.1 hypothetical protein SAMN05216287_3735 [Pseudomonas kuykendallii]
MSLETKIISLAQAIGADVKALRTAQGDLTSLPTTAKGNLVAAIAEIYGLLGQAGAVIDDNAGNGATSVTWSADKIYDSLELAKQAVKAEILGGASEAYDTLLELQELATGNASTAAALATAVNNRVRFDAAQTLTTAQKLQACTNIGVGDPEHDFAADYATAKA